METIQTYLKQIENLLEQLETMTYNQSTILLHQLEGQEDEVLRMIEEIVTHKDEAIQELVHIEDLFQESYEKNKTALLKSGAMKEVKERVAGILDAKERIKKQEQSNLRLLASRGSRRTEKVEIKPSPQCAINAYKKTQSLT